MKNIFWLPLIASLLMVACTDKELDDNIIPRDGEEVNFSVSVNDNKSRTLYGDEATDGKSIVVNWVKGDKVLVYGTTCSNSSAEYKVDDAADGLNYAGKLVKTGAAGIQWGTATKSDFYSVYPSNSAITPNTTDADGNVTSVKVTTEIRKHQNVTFKKNTNGVWVGQHFSDNSDNPTMTDAVMYAVEKGVTAGTTVNLGYKPFTTVLRFNFAGYQAEGEMGGDINSKIYVNKITINSPFAISGKFSMMVGYDEEKDESFAVVDEENLKVTEDNSQIVIYPDYLPLANAEQLQFDVFAIPQDYVLTKDNYFVVTIETNSGQFTYHMKPTVVDEKKNKMLAGAMHKVNIPMKKISKPFEIPASEWVKYVPRNVYLSELSVPGAWYCMDSGYQGTSIGLNSDSDENGIDDGLEAMYNAGIRSFNIDCRIAKKNCDDFTYELFGTHTTTYEKEWAESDYDKDGSKCYLACAGTEDVAKGVGAGILSTLTGMYSITEGVYVSNVMQQLVKLANKSTTEHTNQHEIIFVVFTFSEKPHTNAVIGDKIFGSVNPVFISEQLTKVLEQYSDYIYTNVNSSTTLGDVIASGKNVVVKINHSNKNFYSAENSFTLPQGIMVSYASMAMNNWGNAKYPSISELDEDQYSSMKISDIYNAKIKNNMVYYYHQAQKTYSSNGTPTIAQRKTAIDDVLNKAKEIYNNSEHNALFQLGIGGSLDDNQLDVAKQLNPYIQGKIESMLSSENSSKLSPLGFVLMNYCLDETYGKPLIKDILEVNTKFYLNRNKELDEWPENCGGNPYEDKNEGSEW